MILGREPVLFYTFIAAALNVAVLLGLDLTDAQQAGILALSLAALGLLARRKVTPVE